MLDIDKILGHVKTSNEHIMAYGSKRNNYDKMGYNNFIKRYVPIENIQDVFMSNLYYNIWKNTVEYLGYGGVICKSIIYKTKNMLYAYGYNKCGELGINLKPTSDNPNSKTDGIVQIPIDATQVKRIFRTKVGSHNDTPDNFDKLFYGTIFIMKDGTVKGCGKNLYGYEGTIQWEIVDLPIQNVDNVFYSNYQWFFIFNDTTMKGCGDNTNGKLGVGNEDKTITDLTVINLNTIGLKDIQSFKNTTLFLYDNGKVAFSGESLWTHLYYYDEKKDYMYNVNFEYLQYPKTYTTTPIDSLLSNITQIHTSPCFEITWYTDEHMMSLVMITSDGLIYHYRPYITITSYSELVDDYKQFVLRHFFYKITDIKEVIIADGQASTVAVLYKNNELRINNLRFNNLTSNNEDYTVHYNTSGKMVYCDFYNIQDVKTIINFSNKNQQDYDFKVELWNNINEYICEINKQWIEKISYKYNTDISSFQIKVPQYIGGRKEINFVFDLIKSNQQIKIRNVDGKNEFYTLKEQVVYNEKNKGYKTFTAYSLEKKLEDTQIDIPQGYYTLYKEIDDTDDTIVGMLNTIEDNCGWSIGYVDERAKNEILTVSENKTLINPFSVAYYWNDYISFFSNSLIFQNNDLGSTLNTVNNSVGKEPLYITITYTNVLLGNGKAGEWASSITRVGNIIHTFDEAFYTNITSIKIYYYDEVGNRDSLKYIFTLGDGTQKTIIKPFVDLSNRINYGNLYSHTETLRSNDFRCGISLTYNTGNHIKKSSPLMLYFDKSNSTASKLLNDISEAFNVAFDFDTSNKIINVNSLYSLGDENNDASSNLGYFILGKSKLGTNNKNNVDSENLMLTYNDIISVNKADTDSEIVSGLRIESSNNISIINVNPNGTNIIENWGYFLNNNLISDSCKARLKIYTDIFLPKKQQEWINMKQSYLDNSSTLITYTSQESTYQQQLIGLQYLLNGYKNSGDTTNANATQAKINDYTTKLSIATTNKNNVQDAVNSLQNQMSIFAKGLRKESAWIDNIPYSEIGIPSGNETMSNAYNYSGYIFSREDIRILDDLASVQNITDDYFTEETALYEHYYNQMVEKTNPKVELTTKSGNMYKYIYYDNNIIKLGSWYNLDDELKEIFNINRIRLISFDYYPNKGDMGSYENLTFSNKITKVNKFRKALDVSSTVSKTAQTVSNLSSSVSNSTTDVSNKVDISTFSQYVNGVQQQINNISAGIQVQSKGSYTITLNANESSKSVDIVTFTSGTFTLPPVANIYCEVGSARVPLPYMRFDANYTFDISTPFNVIITASITKDKITINCNRSQDTSTSSESFTIDYIVFKE